MLYETYRDELRRDWLTFYPDGLLILRGRGCFEGMSQLFYYEQDMGTMYSEQIAHKIKAYHLHFESGDFKRFLPNALDFRALFVTTSQKRLDRLQSTLCDTPGYSKFFFTTMDKVTPDTVFDEKIWLAGKIGWTEGEPKPEEMVSLIPKERK